jgi:hypothetical protein
MTAAARWRVVGSEGRQAQNEETERQQLLTQRARSILQPTRHKRSHAVALGHTTLFATESLVAKFSTEQGQRYSKTYEKEKNKQADLPADLQGSPHL